MLDITANKAEYQKNFSSVIDSAMYTYSAENSEDRTFDVILFSSKAVSSEGAEYLANQYHEFLTKQSNIGTFKAYKIIVISQKQSNEFVFD